MAENTAIIVRQTDPVLVSSAQANSDAQLAELWLHGRSARTQQAYRAAWERFRGFCPASIRTITLGDLQSWIDELDRSHLAPATRALMISGVKSLLGFAFRIGYISFDVGRVVRLPKQRDTLAERILSEAEVHRLVARETNARNALLLRLMYCSGARLSELCGLRWRDCQDRGNGDGQIALFGKGAKTRLVLLPTSVWSELMALRGSADDDAPVFVSREGGALCPRQVQRIVAAAARRAKLRAQAVSPHWLRHAHASHAIDRGAPLSLVASTLGHCNISTTGRYLHARPADSSSRYLSI